jgi:phytoene dehydrogenase-like protein
MPIPRGGAGAISDALTRLLQLHGGVVLTGRRASQLVVRGGRAVAVRAGDDEFVARKAILATVEPRQLFLGLVGAGHLPSSFVRQVRRFRSGTGVFTVHCALASLPSFKAEALNGALAFHLGRGVDELRRGAADARTGTLPAHPLLIAGIQTLVDPSRAPDGRHTLWAMTHVPSRVSGDRASVIRGTAWREVARPFLERVLNEIEAYAPGFQAQILDAACHTPDDLEAHNANLVGGDLGAGSYMLDQQLVFRPLPGWFHYHTPIKGLYMSGASTHPGGGVHGAAGSNAARVLLADLRLRRLAEPMLAAGSVARRIYPGARPGSEAAVTEAR